MSILAVPHPLSSLRYETSDHKASRQDEADRIRESGGQVMSMEYDEPLTAILSGRMVSFLVAVCDPGVAGRWL